MRYIAVVTAIVSISSVASSSARKAVVLMLPVVPADAVAIAVRIMVLVYFVSAPSL